MQSVANSNLNQTRFKGHIWCNTTSKCLKYRIFLRLFDLPCAKSALLKFTRSEQKFDDSCGIGTQSSVTLQVTSLQKARISAALGVFDLGCYWQPLHESR